MFQKLSHGIRLVTFFLLGFVTNPPLINYDVCCKWSFLGPTPKMLEDEWLRYILYCFGILSVSTLYCVMWPWCGDAAQARPITSLYCRDQMWAPSILYIAAQTKCPPTILAASLPAYIPFHFPSFMFSFLIWSLTSGPKKDKKTKRQKDKKTKKQKDKKAKRQKDKKTKESLWV